MSTTPTIKVRRVTGHTDSFEVVIDDQVIGTVTKSQRNVAAKRGRTRTGYKMKTVWLFTITVASVPVSRSFGTVITTKKDAVDLIVERVTANR